MTKALSETEVELYRREGYVFPVPVMPAAEAVELRANLQAFEAAHGGKLEPEHRNKAHLLFKWLDDLFRDARMLDPVEDLIGLMFIQLPGHGPLNIRQRFTNVVTQAVVDSVADQRPTVQGYAPPR